MNSKERIVAAINNEEVDYLPCSIYINNNLEVDGYNLKNADEQLRLYSDLGVDPVVGFGVPTPQHPEVKTKTWTENISGELHPILFKEYKTPARTLRMGVKHYPDWPYGMDIQWSDHTASNIYEPLIKTPDDVAAFEYLWQPPTQADVDKVKDNIQDIIKRAEKYQAPLCGYAGAGLATLMFIMGAENIIMFAMDYPEAFKKLAEIDSKGNIGRIKLCAQCGADFVKRFGGYEQTNFYSPGIFKNIVLPLLKDEVKASHEAGVPIYYRVVTGMEPILDDISTAGFDCIEGGEPHLSNCSLEMWHDAFGDNACSWTGISTPVILGGSDEELVRKEVRHCVEVFGKKRYILGVTNSIRNHFPWENTLAMIDEWKKIR